MKKELKNKLIFISGVVFALALLFVSVQMIQAGWTAPTAPFPGGNIYPPIDTGPDVPSTSNPKGLAVREGRIELGGKVWSDALGKSIFQPGVSLMLQDQSSIGNAFGSFAASINGMTQIFSRGNLLVNSTGLVLPRTATGAPSNSPIEGSIYYDTAKKGVKLYNGTSWVDIGSGSGVLKPTVVLTGGSGSVGMIFNKDANDTSGTNSPMLVFSGFGASQVGLLKNINSSVLSSLFHIDRASALTIPCDNDVTACGGGGGGTGGGHTDGLTQPIWWMRQSGTIFSIMASDPTLQDLRYSLTLTKGGGVLAGGPNNSVIPGYGEYFEYDKDVGGYVKTAPSGLWCGLYDGNAVIWKCEGLNPFDSCPLGYKRTSFGKHTGLGQDWTTCVKL